jgi:hypothetical protein
MKALSAAASVLLCVLLIPSTFSQTTNATLGGTVSDASGALIPGVSVTATNTATGIVTTVVSNEAGAYQFASLQTGTYKVSAELPGFQTQSFNVTLGVSQQARLNFSLQVGNVAQNVEVTIAADTLLATSSSSVGTVLPEYKLNDLPLGSRNIQALISTTAGTGPQGADGDISGNFAGGRISAVNVTRDGFVASDGRYTHGEFSQTYTSPDLIEEVRVVTATVDAENGRGSGQVQMVTRSGTNQFKGSAVWTNRNSKLDAANWFNNFNGVAPDWENRNQFAFRLGGPIKKNKTFFFFLLEEQRDALRQIGFTPGTVLTPLARQGIFRYFPGVDNQNATGTSPTVDRQGNPVLNGQPATPQQLPLFGRDPLRPTFDPTGFVQNTLLANMPLPNDYTVGDGLNTAGIRFTRRIYGMDVADGNSNDQNNRDQFNIRIDHNFSSKHKLSGIYTYERSIDHSTQAGLRSYPSGFDGGHSKWPRLYTISLVSTLSPKMVNELRGGLRRSAIASWAPFYVGRNLDGTGSPSGSGAESFKLLPTNNGIPFQAVTSVIGTNGFMNWNAGFGSTRSSRSPLWQYADTLSWTVGKHAFKMGGEYRRDSTIGWNDNNMTPQAIFGAASGAAVTGINNVAGLSANNITSAQNMLNDLSGSIARIMEGFDLPNATATSFQGYKDGYVMHDRDWHSNEFSGFFKDDWKFSSRLTLNLGLHWEYFGVPYEGKGRAGQPAAGNEIGACGISCGALTVDQFVGKNSPNPGKQLYKDDYNNFAPSVGLSYSLPWFGRDKTVLRMGYGWAYTGGALKSANTILDAIAGAAPGAVELSGGNGITYNPSSYTNLANLTLPIPQQYAPLAAPPINGQRSDTLSVYATNRSTPYVQNFNFEIQRAVTNTLTLDVAYVGSKGTKLFGGRNLNVVNINALAGGQTLLDAFKITRAGGDAPFFNALLNGINIGGGATKVDGTAETGSMALRQNGTTRPFIANGNIGALANFLNTNTAGTSIGGGLYTTNGFPQSFFVLNPQFSTVNYYDNSVGSTYHSMQVQATKRLSQGLTDQFTYTWSKALDISDGDGIVSPRDPNHISLEKGRAGFDRTHIISNTGTYELPFGSGRALLSNATGFIQRIVERWTLGGIFTLSSGSPLTITAPVSTLWQTTTGATPVQVTSLPSGAGKVTYLSNGVTYFPNVTQIKDPSLAGVTTANSTANSFNNLAIADKSGNLIFVNPAPGQIGTLGRNTLIGPGSINLDMDLIKRIKLTESKTFEFRVDAVNVLNHPNFGSPNVNINSTSFGRITSASGARRFTINARLNF